VTFTGGKKLKEREREREAQDTLPSPPFASFTQSTTGEERNLVLMTLHNVSNRRRKENEKKGKRESGEQRGKKTLRRKKESLSLPYSLSASLFPDLFFALSSRSRLHHHLSFHIQYETPKKSPGNSQRAKKSASPQTNFIFAPKTHFSLPSLLSLSLFLQVSISGV
jgi:hypothetical protein